MAFAQEADVLGATGLILMCWAAGSLVAGVVTGTITWRASPARRFRIGSVALAVSLVPLPFVDQPIVIAGLLAISGMAIAPTLIASVAVTQGAVLPNRLTEALGWTSTGLVSGVAAGAADRRAVDRLLRLDGRLLGRGRVRAVVDHHRRVRPESRKTPARRALSSAPRDTATAGLARRSAESPLR